ncbi:hypothetical protein [Flavobacterium sp.]|uniref:hypothetical protein n=1 Tax=Flavobacterium sp. TaxID=239 RepID=UPI0037C0F00F
MEYDVTSGNAIALLASSILVLSTNRNDFDYGNHFTTRSGNFTEATSRGTTTAVDGTITAIEIRQNG